MAASTHLRKRILVVDDEPFVCDALRMMLSFDGHVVETAQGAKEALTLFDQAQFDVVITDFAMPVMKGDELAAAIKAKKPTQPIVMITAYAEMLETSAVPLHVDALISKPFLLENLRAVLAKFASTPAVGQGPAASPGTAGLKPQAE